MADDDKRFGKTMNVDIPRKNKVSNGWNDRFSGDRSMEKPSLFQFPRSLSITYDSSAAMPLKKLAEHNEETNGYRKRTTTFSSYGSNDSGVSSPTPEKTSPLTSSVISSRSLFRRSNSVSVANPSEGKYRQDASHGEYFKFSIGQLFGEKHARSPEPKPLPKLKPKSPSSQVNTDDLVSMLCDTSLR